MQFISGPTKTQKNIDANPITPEVSFNFKKVSHTWFGGSGMKPQTLHSKGRDTQEVFSCKLTVYTPSHQSVCRPYSSWGEKSKLVHIIHRGLKKKKKSWSIQSWNQVFSSFTCFGVSWGPTTPRSAEKQYPLGKFLFYPKGLHPAGHTCITSSCVLNYNWVSWHGGTAGQQVSKRLFWSQKKKKKNCPQLWFSYWRSKEPNLNNGMKGPCMM